MCLMFQDEVPKTPKQHLAVPCRLGNEIDRVKKDDASRLQEECVAVLGRWLGFEF